MARAISAVVGVSLLVVLALPATGQSLRGSRTAMRSQNEVARSHDYTFLRTSTQVQKFIDLGLLVPVSGNADYKLANVSYPYARPAVRTFVERLASQYRAACGEQLVVTSLTRPEARQPRNASDLSVHPAGMAVDLRIPTGKCRSWLESTLLELERKRVVDATRERYPPHYHVAIYPEPYLSYVDALIRRATGTRLAEASLAPEAPAQTASGPSDPGITSADVPFVTYLVRKGDTLWGISRRHNTTVEALQEVNGLASARIKAGQTISIPSP